MTDRDLLHEYLEYTSDSAFVELVRRHLDLVYATCLRDTGDEALAETATQDVFSLLAHKAGSIDENGSVIDWLFERSRTMTRNIVLRELRDLPTARPAAGIESHLNDAIMHLSDIEREAILLRACERRDFHDVGTEIGAAEEVAKSRVAAAFTSMCSWLGRQGVIVHESELAGFFENYGATASPGLSAQSVAETALGSRRAPANAPAAVTSTVPTPPTVNAVVRAPARRSSVPLMTAVATILIVAGIGTWLIVATSPTQHVAKPMPPTTAQAPEQAAPPSTNAIPATSNNDPFAASSDAAASSTPVSTPTATAAPLPPHPKTTSTGKPEAADVPTDANGLIAGGPPAVPPPAQPPVSTSPPATPTSAPAPSERLMGVVTGDSPSAVMMVDGQERIVTVGADVGNGKVSDIESDHVTITSPDGKSTQVPLSTGR